MDRKVVPIKRPKVVAEVGGPPDEFQVTLAVYGADLVPSEISSRFGMEPTSSHCRGDRQTPGGTPFPTGAWILSFDAIAPESPNEAVARLLGSLPRDEKFWRTLTTQFRVQIRICVLTNQAVSGFDFSAATAALIAATGASVNVSIYFDGGDDEV